MASQGCTCDQTPDHLQCRLWNPTFHRQALITDGERIAYVAHAMVEVIQRLWAADLDTLYSCQGRDGFEPYIGFGTERDVLRALRIIGDDYPVSNLNIRYAKGLLRTDLGGIWREIWTLDYEAQ